MWGNLKNGISGSQYLCGLEIPRVYIILKEGITTYTMYAPLEDAAFVKEYVRVRIGSEKYEC